MSKNEEDMKAHCPKCGGTRFRASVESLEEMKRALIEGKFPQHTCAGCGHKFELPKFKPKRLFH